MKKFSAIITIVIATLIIAGCSDNVIWYSWEEGIDAEWNPTKDNSRETLVLAAARKASDKFEMEELKQFKKKHLNEDKYLMIGFDKELIAENIVTFSQKGILEPDRTEIKVQRKSNEPWSAFYERGFKELVKGSNSSDSVKAKPPDKPNEASPDMESSSSDEKDERIDFFPIYFDWQPGIPRDLAFGNHPYVMEGLDKVILFSATNIGISANKLIKMDVEDFNRDNDMIIIIFSPENMKQGIINFTIRHESGIFSKDVRRKKNEDWKSLYERGFCDVGRMAKLIDCKRKTETISVN